MDVRELIIYWHIIKKRLWLIALLVATTGAGIVGFSFTQPPVYEATVRFQVTALPPEDVTLYQAARGGQYREEIAYTENNLTDLITSLEVAWNTVEEMGLQMKGRELQERVVVEESPGSDFVSVTVTAEDPKLAADLVNTLISVALRRYGELNAYPITMAREFISNQVEQARQDLLAAQADMTRFQIESKVGTLESSISAQHALIRSLALAHDQALAEGNRQEAANYEEIITERQLELQELIQLSSEYATLEAQVRQLQSTYNFLLQKETEARLKENEAFNLGFVQVLGAAQAPNEPEPRVRVSILALGLLVSLVIGLAIAFVWEYLERTQLNASPEPATEGTVGLADAHQRT
jgi:uncharacterized protein involved in exopolysaccharide biosynthesis